MCGINLTPFFTGTGNQENGQDWEQRGLQSAGQAAGAAEEAEEPNLCCELQGHLHVHPNQGHELPDEDGRSHVSHSKSKAPQDTLLYIQMQHLVAKILLFWVIFGNCSAKTHLGLYSYIFVWAIYPYRTYRLSWARHLSSVYMAKIN